MRNDFAKIFEHPELGQVLIVNDVNDEGAPAITCMANAVGWGLGVCSVALVFAPDDTGAKLADQCFNEMGVDGAITMAEGIMSALPKTATGEEDGVHTLKIDGVHFQAVSDGLKHFELHKDDRGYKVGDTLRLRETRHSGEEMADGALLQYTGRECMATVTYILRGPEYDIEAGWVAMSITLEQEGE